MPTTTFPCPCCGSARSCCLAGPCCVAPQSTVLLQWSISGRDDPNLCTCPDALAAGTIELALEWCSGGSARWSKVTCDEPYTCGSSTLLRWHRYRATWLGASSQWQVSVEALSDAELGLPCTGVVTCVLFSGTRGGDCCGAPQGTSQTSFGCCDDSGAVTTTWSLSVNRGSCCRDEQGQCMGGTAACDGSCGGLP